MIAKGGETDRVRTKILLMKCRAVVHCTRVAVGRATAGTIKLAEYATQGVCGGGDQEDGVMYMYRPFSWLL